MVNSKTGDIMDNVPIIGPELNLQDVDKDTDADALYKNGNDGDGEIKPEDNNNGSKKMESEHQEENSIKEKNNDPELSAEGVDNQTKLRFDTESSYSVRDPKIFEQQKLINESNPSTELEKALYDELQRKEVQIEKLIGEVVKLKQFVSKRKQVYKRKRKDDGAPTRALSAYNIFVQDRFSLLAKEHEEALKSSDSDAQLKRVPPASLVASTGNKWKELPAEQKAYYEERAKADRKRYEEEMAKYHPPDRQSNRKRSKTGYNMFFSYHVNNLKSSNNSSVPSERGSVARLVGNAWKELSNEQKMKFEQMAEKENCIDSDDEHGNEPFEEKRRSIEYAPGSPEVIDPNAHQRQIIPPPMGHAPAVHTPAHHDPRMYPPPPHGPHGPYQPYPPPPPGYYEYPPPPPYPHASPLQHPPPHQYQHISGQRNGSRDTDGRHQVPPPHPGHPPHPYPAPPHPHHHHYHPHPPPPPYYAPPQMEQR